MSSRAVCCCLCAGAIFQGWSAPGRSCLVAWRQVGNSRGGPPVVRDRPLFMPDKWRAGVFCRWQAIQSHRDPC